MSGTMAERRGARSSRERLRALYSRGLSTATLPAGNIILAVPIPGAGPHRLGQDHDGRVCLILSVGPGEKPARPDIQLQNLSVRWRIACDITQPGGAHESIIGTLITCSAESEQVRRLFLDLFDQALDEVGPEPTERQIGAWIDHATRLFAALEGPESREIRGLWGELLVMCESSDPTTLARRWHEDPQERFDFRAGDFALEVKTCNDLDRVHQFALAQIRPVPKLDVVIASVPVESDPQGASVLDLLSELETKITDRDVLSRVREVTARTGMASLAGPTPVRFDRHLAREGLRFMRADLVPAIEERPPVEVLAIQLHVRCRDVPASELGAFILTRLT